MRAYVGVECEGPRVRLICEKRVYYRRLFFAFLSKNDSNPDLHTRRVFLKRKFARAFFSKFSQNIRIDMNLRNFSKYERWTRTLLNWWNDSCPRLVGTRRQSNIRQIVYAKRVEPTDSNSTWIILFMVSFVWLFLFSCLPPAATLHGCTTSFRLRRELSENYHRFDFILSVSCIFHRWNYKAITTDRMQHRIRERHLGRIM